MVRVGLMQLAAGRWRLVADGHAYAAPAGRDLVCAGVSTLIQTLVGGCEETLAAHVTGELESGCCDVTVTAARRGGETLDKVVLLFAAGFERMARSHPNHLVFTLEQRKEVAHHGD